MVSHIMGTDKDVFDCGIAVAPVTNKAFYGEFRHATLQTLVVSGLYQHAMVQANTILVGPD